MAELRRFLITTADERTWKYDRPVIFLGEWCCRYDRKHVWSTMDFIVASPFGLGRARKDEDHLAARAVEDALTNLVCDELNTTHGTNNSRRNWQIILGHWLRRYVNVVFNRYYTLKQCLENHPISGTTVLEADNRCLSSPDSLSFVWACNDDIWNNQLYARILAFLSDGEFPIELAPIDTVFGADNSAARSSISARTRLKRTAHELAQTVAEVFARDDDAVIVNSYLPLIETAKLQLSLGQIPNIPILPVPKAVDPSSELRKELASRISDGTEKGFSACVRALLFELLPSCFLEGFVALRGQAEQLPWPRQPKFIFTSNSFDFDEVFKCWTADKVEQGVPYITGQHGNNYGTHRLMNPSIEESTADRFLTWGWANDQKKQIPAFNFKTVGHKARRLARNGGLLLIELHPPHRLGPEDKYFEYGIYQEEQFRFVEKLPDDICRQLTVRLHSAHRKFNWSDEERWKNRSQHVCVETGEANIQELIAQSRLVVHSYDSTGILETLSLNIPTICFWQNGLDHLLDDAKAHYELLRNSSILIDTPEQAADFVGLHWDNIGAWWNSKEVQDAREVFCQQYSRIERRPIRTLKRILMTCAKNEISN